MTTTPIVHYFDYKSPYAYLAQAETYQLDEELGVQWRPYTLDIPKFLGAAKLDASGHDTLDERNDHQWRRVRYAYMDCRRQANDRGLVIRGPRKIFDSTVAHRAFLFASKQGTHRAFHDATFERFWKREIDIEDIAAVERLLEETGSETADFRGYLNGEGQTELARIQSEAEEKGVFGVPSYLLSDELFFGNERIDLVRATANRISNLEL